MNAPINLKHLYTISLRHDGDCSLIGATPEGTLYAEEIYGDEGWMAQHKISANGVILSSVDEDSGDSLQITPLAIPVDIVKPARVWHTMSLNFAGARHRGLRAPERVDEMVRTLSMQEKMAVIQRLDLDVIPPMLIGMSESYVLAEAEIIHPTWFVVCRRIRFAYALPFERIDIDNESEPDGSPDGDPYDYDTRVIYVAHFFNPVDDDDPPLISILEGLGGVTLYRPMDCLVAGDRLYIADGGELPVLDDEAGRTSRVHVWQIDLPEMDSPDDAWRKKLYG